jgi:hypothetical protein
MIAFNREKAFIHNDIGDFRGAWSIADNVSKADNVSDQ